MIRHPLPGRQRGRIFLIAVIMVAALAAGLVASRFMIERTQDLRAAQLFPTPRALTDFQMETAAGEPFTRADLEGQWSLLFFGFTNCPDICPDTLAMLSQSMEQLRLMRREELPQVVFVSVDPERDQGELLADYVQWFDPEFVAVTGPEEQLQALTRQLGIVYFREQPDEQTGFYNVDHSAAVLIIDPQGRLHGRFGHPLVPEDVVADLFRISS
ncbi:MAG: SCO family protein [Wenzhouxiangella sp.]